MGHAWSVLCPVEERDCMTAALRTLDPQADCEFARDAEELRRRMVASARGERSALIGLTASGVSDVNLAAAVARDGHADKVVLALRSPSGSLRSRAARAGVDTVIDLDGVVSAPSAEKGVASVPGLLPECDGGRVSVAPGPSRASVGVRAPVLTFCSGRLRRPRGACGWRPLTLTSRAGTSTRRWALRVGRTSRGSRRATSRARSGCPGLVRPVVSGFACGVPASAPRRRSLRLRSCLGCLRPWHVLPTSFSSTRRRPSQMRWHLPCARATGSSSCMTEGRAPWRPYRARAVSR